MRDILDHQAYGAKIAPPHPAPRRSTGGSSHPGRHRGRPPRPLAEAPGRRHLRGPVGRPLKDVQKARLEERLRAIEKRPVACTYVLDPAIVGGLVVRKGNKVYDVSLKGQLERLKEKIRER